MASADNIDRRRQRTGAFHLTWRGLNVQQAVNEATKKAMRETLEACVTQAKENAPVDTGALRADIAYREPEETGSRINGRWGNWDIRYSIFQEYGTVFIEPRYYLRRAMDQEYPHLKERIKKYTK